MPLPSFPALRQLIKVSTAPLGLVSAFGPSLHRQAFPNSFAHGPLSVAPKCHIQSQSPHLIPAKYPLIQPPRFQFPRERIWLSCPVSGLTPFGSCGGQFCGKEHGLGRSPQVSVALWSTSGTCLLCLDFLIFLSTSLSYFNSFWFVFLSRIWSLKLV